MCDNKQEANQRSALIPKSTSRQRAVSIAAVTLQTAYWIQAYHPVTVEYMLPYEQIHRLFHIDFAFAVAIP